jgi:hypothetical protein
MPAYDSLLNDHMKTRREQAELQTRSDNCIDENKRLKDQLTVARNEIDKLRSMTVPQANQSSETEQFRQRVLGLAKSVQGMSDVFRAEAIVNGLRSINARIDAAYLIPMMNGMTSDPYKADVIKGAAPYLVYPLDSNTMQQLTGTIRSAVYKRDVIAALSHAAQGTHR